MEVIVRMAYVDAEDIRVALAIERVFLLWFNDRISNFIYIEFNWFQKSIPLRDDFFVDWNVPNSLIQNE
jgi:hypothetical protein